MADNFAKKKSFLTIFFNSKTYLNKTELSLLLKAYNMFQIKYKWITSGLKLTVTA